MITTEGYPDPTFDAVVGNLTRERRRQPKKPLVYICSPYAGDTARNTVLARRCSRFAVDQGVIPLAPHLLFPQFMDDTDPEERKLALYMGKKILSHCSELWVFGSNISDGMASEIKLAQKWQKPVHFFTMEEVLES